MPEPIPFSVGIISAFNPLGNKTNLQANQKAQQILKKEIAGMRLKYMERKGAYMGHQEKHLVICNISRREIVKLADKYLQDAVIYGERDGDDYTFSWIEGGKTIKEKKTKVQWPVRIPKFEV